MTDPTRPPKLRPWHLDRSAFVYVRQSTPQQVLDHQESTARQYALAGRAAALGWPPTASPRSTMTWARADSRSRDGPTGTMAVPTPADHPDRSRP